MISDYVKGGIRAPSIDVMAKSLNLAWISRFLPEGQTYKESWKVIPSYLLEKFCGLNFLLRCNYDKKFLARINLPQFYKSILQNFLELKISYNKMPAILALRVMLGLIHLFQLYALPIDKTILANGIV